MDRKISLNIHELKLTVMIKNICVLLLCSSSFCAFSQVTQQWVQRYLTSGNETPRIAKTDGSGNVYVGGGINYDTNDKGNYIYRLVAETAKGRIVLSRNMVVGD